MQLKKIRLLFLVALLAFLSLIAIETNAESYTVDIYHTPETVYVGDEVTIYVVVIDSAPGEEFETGTCLDYSLDGVMYTNIKPEQSLPAQMQTLTWLIGPFEKNDYVGYKVHLDFLYANNYESDWIYFKEGTPPPKPPREPLTRMQIIYISCAVVVGFALIAVVIVAINRRRR